MKKNVLRCVRYRSLTVVDKRVGFEDLCVKNESPTRCRDSDREQNVSL